MIFFVFRLEVIIFTQKSLFIPFTFSSFQFIGGNMNPFRNITVGLLCVSFVALGAPQWKLIGLASKKINCIALDTKNNLVAGTSDSIFVKGFTDDRWAPCFAPPGALNYVKIVSIKNNYMATIRAKGASTDGLYLMENTVGTTPFYTLKKIDSLKNPQTLAVGPNCLYVGETNFLYQSIYDTGSFMYMPLKKLKTPQYCFGVEMPACTDLHYWQLFNKLFACGYDKSPMTGPGNLLIEQNDSLVIFLLPRINNATSLASGYDRGSNAIALFVGTTDTTIVVIRPTTGAGFHKIPSPNKEAVRVYTINDSMQKPVTTTLIGMTNSGVYVYENTTWKELGNLPDTAVQCVYESVLGGPNTLYAATNRGVYGIEYTPQVSIDKGILLSKSGLSFEINRLPAGVLVSFTLELAENIAVSLYTLAGKTIVSTRPARFAPGKHTVMLANLSAVTGVVFVKVEAGERVRVGKTCLY
jgi:hypothetical protein